MAVVFPAVTPREKPLEVKASAVGQGGMWSFIQPGEGAYWPDLSVTEWLARSPGLRVTRSGGRGLLHSLFLRGGGSGDTLFLLDGVPLNDPATPGESFDLSLLDSLELENLEILRGAGVSWGGPGGLNGVVRLRGARGAGRANGSFLLDTLGGGRGRFSFGVGHEQASLRLGLGVVSARDYAADPVAGHRERDAHLQYTLQIKPWLRLGNGLEVEGTLRWAVARTDLDEVALVGAVDDGDFQQRRRRDVAALRLRYEPSDGCWEQGLLFWVLRTKQRWENGPAHPDTQAEPFKSGSDGRRGGFSWSLGWRPARGHSGLLELEVERRRLRNTQGPAHDLRRVARFSWRLERGSYLVSAGLRLLHLPRAGKAFAWNLSGEMETPLTGLYLSGAVGRQLKAPSLFNLYDPRYGNPELRVERSLAWDTGLIYRSERWRWSGSFYSSRLRNRVGFQDGRYLNVQREKLQGIEAAVSLQATPGLEFYADYTLSRAHAAARELPRRGYARLNLGSRWRHNALDLGVHLRHEGRRLDLGGRLPSYAVLGLRVGRRLQPRLELFLQMDNVLDKNYQEVAGYWSPGITVHAGLRLSAERKP